jgi:hypothetical protein
VSSYLLEGRTGNHMYQMGVEVRPLVTQQYTHSSERNKVYLTHPKGTYALSIAKYNLY